MWISTFILTPIAIYLLIKATNDSSLLDTDWYHDKFKELKQKIDPVWLPIKNRVTSTRAWQKKSNHISKIKFKKAKS